MCDVTSRNERARTPTRPRWGRLYTLAILLLAALGAVEVAAFPEPIETVAQCGLVLGGVAAMARWARRNRAALDQQDWCACAGAQVTARVIPSLRRARVECLVEREHVHALVSDGGARGDPLPAVHGP